jgi:hypothetical protein
MPIPLSSSRFLPTKEFSQLLVHDNQRLTAIDTSGTANAPAAPAAWIDAHAMQPSIPMLNERTLPTFVVPLDDALPPLDRLTR